MKTEAKKKTRLSTVLEAALEEAGLAKETILAAIPMDGVVLVTKDSMPIVELLQMLDRLNLYAAEMLTAVAAECGPCEKADEALTVEDVLEECEVTIPAWAREQAGIPENAKLACFVNEGDVIVGEAEACAPDLADVPRYVLKFFVDNHLNLRALDDTSSCRTMTARSSAVCTAIFLSLHSGAITLSHREPAQHTTN